MDVMSPEVTQFEPPEGIFPHEAAYIFNKPNWYELNNQQAIRVYQTGIFELVSSDGLVYVPGEGRRGRYARGSGADLPRPPYLAGLLDAFTGNAAGVSMGGLTGRLRARLVEAGWMDARGKLTASGLELQAYLHGYRSYLRTAMRERLHHAAAESSQDREVAFGMALGLVDVAGADRVIKLRAGQPITRLEHAVYDVLGGKMSRQHDPKAGFDAFFRGFVIFWCIFASTLLILYFFTRDR